MPETKVCPNCKGKGRLDVLISQHGDEKENIECKKCFGKGKIHEMTDQEFDDYMYDSMDGW
jgi:DnaJ-class molecular chaperone